MYSLSLSLEREILEHVVDTSSICGGLSSFNDGFFDKKVKADGNESCEKRHIELTKRKGLKNTPILVVQTKALPGYKSYMANGRKDVVVPEQSVNGSSTNVNDKVEADYHDTIEQETVGKLLFFGFTCFDHRRVINKDSGDVLICEDFINYTQKYGS